MALKIIKDFSFGVCSGIIELKQNSTIQKIQEIAPTAISFFAAIASYKIKSYGNLNYSITPFFICSGIQNLLFYFLDQDEGFDKENIQFLIVVFKSSFLISSILYLGSALLTWKLTSFLAAIGYSYLFLDGLEKINPDENNSLDLSNLIDSKESKSDIVTDVKGFPNLGNTCFMNATLKCFLSNENLISLLDENLIKDPSDTDDEFEGKKELLALLKDLKEHYLSKESKESEIKEILTKIRSCSLLKSKFFISITSKERIQESCEELNNYDVRNKKTIRFKIKYPDDYNEKIKDLSIEQQQILLDIKERNSSSELGVLLNDFENLKKPNGLGEGNPKILLAEFLKVSSDEVQMNLEQIKKIPSSKTQEDPQEMFLIISEVLGLEHRSSSSIRLDKASVKDSQSIYTSLFLLDYPSNKSSINLKDLFEEYLNGKKIHTKNVTELKVFTTLLPRFGGNSKISFDYKKSNIKITNFLEPIIIDIHNESNDKDEKIKLKMQSCILHHGESINSGHYTSLTKKDGKWFYHNDNTVNEISDENTLNCNEQISKSIYLATYSVEVLNSD